MARAFTSDLTRLFIFINAQVAGPGPAGTGLSYRQLEQYYIAKKNDADNDKDDVKELAKAALRACGLDDNHQLVSTLDNPGQEKQRAAAAAVLAMSIIKNTSEENLKSQYERLLRTGINESIKELRTLLISGDTRKVPRNSRITLRIL